MFETIGEVIAEAIDHFRERRARRRAERLANTPPDPGISKNPLPTDPGDPPQIIR